MSEGCKSVLKFFKNIFQLFYLALSLLDSHFDRASQVRRGTTCEMSLEREEERRQKEGPA